MAQSTKNAPRPTGSRDTPCPTVPPAECPPGQVTMHRYIHAAPCPEQGCCSHGALLRATEQQNLLLTELLSAVNSLSALLCARKDL